jgi:glutamate synthase domain-containing protein 3
LNQWEKTLSMFVKVVPIEYRRVLEEMDRQRAQKTVVAEPSAAAAMTP